VISLERKKNADRGVRKIVFEDLRYRKVRGCSASCLERVLGETSIKL
jgi:hypothetical protein